jgi:2-haloacid dehalogenase
MDQVLDAFATLPPYPDVKPSLERLLARGIRLASLGNGSKQVADKLFENAGLSSLVELRLSIDDVKHWKPPPSWSRSCNVSAAPMSVEQRRAAAAEREMK